MPTSRAQTLGFPQSHAIVIGIGHYPLIEAHLKNAAKDAKDIAELLKKSQGFDKVLLMTDPTKVEIMALFGWLQDPGRAEHFSFPKPGKPNDPRWEGRSKIEWLKGAGGNGPIKRNRVRPDKAFSWPINTREDSILVYFAGHGIPGEFEEGPAGFLVPSDGSDKLKDNSSMVQMGHLYKALKRLDCLHTLLVLDCCFAGKFRFSDSTRFKVGTQVPKMFKQRFDRYKSNKAWQVLVSCGPDQKASDSASWLGIRDNSPFADTIKKALRGDADLIKDGIITAEELKLYVRDKVESIKEGHKPQYPDLFHMAPHRGGEFLFLGDGFDENSLEDRPLLNPYKGLRSFTPEDKPWFFGREEALKLFIQKTHATSFLVVSGASAVGKSSFAKAGVFPRLQKEYGFEELLELRPGANPWSGKGAEASTEGESSYFTGLKGMCEALDPVSGLAETTLASTLTVFDPLKSPKKRVLLIDQFEEVFTECKDPVELEQFAKALVTLAKLSEKTHMDDGENGCLRVVLTLRSDFEWQLEAMGQLGKHLQEGPGFHYHLFRLHPPSQVEIREALTRPAGVEVWEFEGGLVDQIIEDINYSPAAFPLMSFAMGKLFDLTVEKGQKDEMGLPKRVFTHHLYNDPNEGVGGIIGALRGSADKLYLGFDPGDENEAGVPMLINGAGGQSEGRSETTLQAVMRKIILRLIQANEGSYTRRRVFQANGTRDNFISELEYPEDEDGSLVEQVLEALESHQLIVRGKDLNNGQDYVELAHDSLITNWPRCQQWIKDAGNDMLQLHRQLWEAVIYRNKHGDFISPDFMQDSTRQETAESIATRNSQSQNISAYWDSNPKLMQVLESIIKSSQDLLHKNDGNSLIKALDEIELGLDDRTDGLSRLDSDRDIFQQLRSTWRKFGRIDNLEDLNSGVSGHNLLDALLAFGNHWLNIEEGFFIIESWQKRSSDIAFLKQQRDEAVRAKEEAIQAKEIAEQKATEAKGIALAAKARGLKDTKPTVAANLAYAAYKTFPSEETLEAKIDVYVKDNTYRKIIGARKIVRAVAFSPDGKLLAIGSSDNTARVFYATGEENLRTFQGHTHQINSVAFSSDSKFVLTASSDGTARCWSMDNPKESISFKGHHGPVHSAVFSLDGKHILTGSSDSTIKLWDANTGKALKQYEGHTAAVTSVAFAPDGKHFLTGSSDGTAKLWNLNKDSIIGGVKDPRETLETLHSVAFSPDGKHYLIGSSNTHAYVCETGTGTIVQKLTAHTGPIYGVAFSFDGTKILTCSFDNSAILWDAARGQVISRFTGHRQSVYSGAISTDGNSILTGGHDNAARLWDPISGKEFFKITGHRKEIIAFDLSQDGKWVATGASDSSAQLWDMETGDLVHNLEGHIGWVNAVAIDPYSTYILTGASDFSLKLWNRKTGKEVRSFKGHSRQITAVGFSPDGKKIISASRDKTARIWELNTGKVILEFGGHGRVVSAAVFTPDGTHVLTSSQDGTAKLLEIATGKVVRQFTGNTQGILTMTLSVDGKRLVTCGNDHSIRIFEIDTGKELHHFTPELIEPDDEIKSIALSPNHKWLLVGESSYAATLWEVESGKLLRKYLEHESGVSSVAFSLDGEHAITGSWDGAIRIWNIAQGKEIHSFEHTGQITSANFSPDDKTILTVSNNKAINLWDAITGKKIKAFEHDMYNIECVVFSPDGKTLLIGSRGEKASIRNLTTGKEICRLEGQSAMYSAAFSKDGKQVVGATWDPNPRIWDTQTGKELHMFQGHTKKVYSVAFSPDETRIVTGSEDATAKVWEVSSGKELFRLTGHRYSVRSVAFSPDGKTILTGSDDSSLKLWKADTGELIRNDRIYGFSSTSAAFSPDGKMIMTNFNLTATLLNVATGEEIRNFVGHKGRVVKVAFSSDGKKVLTASWDKTVKLWDMSTAWDGNIYKLNKEERKKYGIEVRY